MDFSRLDDTKFPNLDTASPYALKNTFDYTRWIPNTKVHLVNVLWNSDYSNVVKFENDTARDAWFDAISDTYTLTLKSNARIVPDGTIKLPLPYDVAARYNYLYIEIPLATSPDQLIQNETDSGIRRWYFFVGDISYSAPNTTVMALQPDVWTNFIDSSRINYMMLARGHAPVSVSDTDTYLKNPIENNKYLLAPDVNYDDSSVVRDSKYVPFGNGIKYICLASTTGYMQIENGECGTVQAGSSFSSPTFSNTSDWYGYQLQVDGYGFGNGQDMRQLKACVNPYNRPGAIIPSSLDIYAFPASDSTFLPDVMNQSPAFLRTVKAMFVVDENMIMRTTKLSFCGHDMWFCIGRDTDLPGYDLNKNMFGFDLNEQRFAKLFTYPYSRIEVSDNNGKTVEVRIENTGKIGMHMLTSVVFPVLDFRVFLTGINGVGSQSYSWRNLGNDEIAKLIPNGDWDKLSFELGIPTYSIYMDSETAYMLDNYSGMQNAREQALTNYHNSVRTANLGHQNSYNSTDNAYRCSVNSANAAQSNAKDLAATANSNANDSANTVQTNANAMAGTTQTNTDNSASCNYSNVGLTMTANTANANAANAASSNVMTNTNTMAQGDNNDANLIIQATTKEENEVTTATTTNSADANKQTSVASGAVSGAAAGGGGLGSAIGAVAGGVLGYVTSSISADCANANATIVTQANSSVADATRNMNTNKVRRHTLGSQNNTGYMNDNRTNQANNNNTMLDGQRNNTYNTTTTNATNLYNTQTANSARTRNMEVTNAGRTLTTSNQNADRTRNAAVDNAASTQTAGHQNADRSDAITVMNAQETLITAQDSQRHSYYDAKRGTPVQLTDYTGDGTNWVFGQTGIQFRLRTQSDSAIAQTAAQFARFGYTLNQLWDVQSSGLNLMKNFTYWQASDVWVDVRNVASSEVGDMISDMFRNGVTVWRDPDKIGKVGIYDN